MDSSNIESDSTEFGDWLQFAEVLYKCRLCETVPVVLTSKESFMAHLRDLHTGQGAANLAACKVCSLKFGSNEDLKSHFDKCHTQVPVTVASTECPTHSQNPATASQQNLDSWKVNLQDGKGKAMRVAQEANSATTTTPGLTEPSQPPPPGQVIHPRKGKRLPQTDVVVTAHLNRGELQKKFGKYASKILIGNEWYFYCQVCMFKTGVEQEFYVHFNCDEHRRTVLKLEQPWTQSHQWTEGQGVQEESSKVKSNLALTNTPITHWGMNAQHSRPKKKKIPSKDTKDESSTEASLRSKHSEEEEEQDEDLETSEDEDTDSEDDTEDEDSNSPDTSHLQTLAKNAAQLAVANIQRQTAAAPSQESGPESLSREDDKSVQSARISKCMRCNLTYNSYKECCKHCMEVHGDKDPLDVGIGESHKVFLIKPHLQALLVAADSTAAVAAHSYVCRDELLARLQLRLVDKDGVQSWGAACNRAVRECFPDSRMCRRVRRVKERQQVRRGAVNKTLYMGVKLADLSAVVASPAAQLPLVENSRTSAAALIRDVGKDTAILMEELPVTVRWTGNLESCVSRDILLQFISGKLGDPSIVQWGISCNRAVRQLYPDVAIKRRGSRVKITYFHGLEFIENYNGDENVYPGSHDPNQPIGDEVENAENNSRGKFIKEEGDDLLKQVESEMNVSLAQLSSQTVATVTSNHTVAKLALLHPGPYFTSRSLCRRYQYKIANAEKAIVAMELLETYGLGQSFTLKTGNVKGFFKATPSEALRAPLLDFGVELEDYQNVFSQRDPKLEDLLHDKMKALHPSPEVLHQFYSH